VESGQYGKGERGDELPEELRFKQGRLWGIKETKQILGREAREHAQKERLHQERKNGIGKSREIIEADIQRLSLRSLTGILSITSPESRIMKDSATKSFEQSYNCQPAVDGHCQVIVATRVSQEANDKQQFKPMVEKLKMNLEGEKPGQMSTDSGYFSKENVSYLAQEHMDGYVATGRIKHGDRLLPAPRGRIPKDASLKDCMSRKLRTFKGRGFMRSTRRSVNRFSSRFEGSGSSCCAV